MNGRKLTGFDSLICLSLSNGGGLNGTDPITAQLGLTQENKSKNMLPFAKSYLAHNTNRTCFSIEGIGDTKQAALLYFDSNSSKM